MFIGRDALLSCSAPALGILLACAIPGCDSEDADRGQPESLVPEDGEGTPLDDGFDAEFEAAVDAQAGSWAHAFGQYLFRHETFDGNGRTCQTCHTVETGALSPAQVEAAWQEDPNGPLFRALDSDDGTGASYDRLRSDATVLVHIPLPEGWSIVGDPEATSATFRRGIPTIVNTAALDPILMYDGRNSSLQEQAAGAINAHAEPGRQPTEAELDAIADFEVINRFFSNPKLRKWFQGKGPAPELPEAHTEAEIRGRAWIEPSDSGVCGHCHGGPMLNETTEFLVLPFPPGTRFFSAFVSEFNTAGNPVYTFEVDNGDGTSTLVETPDPGRALITGDLADVNTFKIPTLWGATETAPYFHDNSAADLHELGLHYSEYFQIVGVGALSEQDIADINAYLQLLK